MKIIATILLCFSILFFFGCKSDNIGNTGIVDSSKVGKINTVLILGNSIVRHGPLASVGWSGDWGMAATAIDSDFVHIIKSRIQHAKPKTFVRFINIAEFERFFPSYDLANLDSLKSADMIIVKISENVDDKKAADSNFYESYSRLITHLDPGNKAVKIIADGFWEKGMVNAQITKYAQDKKYQLVSLTDLSADSTNEAWGQFKDPGVEKHPSDKGMRLIADRIWNQIDVYFK